MHDGDRGRRHCSREEGTRYRKHHGGRGACGAIQIMSLGVGVVAMVIACNRKMAVYFSECLGHFKL